MYQWVSVRNAQYQSKYIFFFFYPLEDEGAIPNMVSGVTGIIGLMGKGNIVVLSRWFLMGTFLVDEV